jgi:acetyl esterase/lipase
MTTTHNQPPYDTELARFLQQLALVGVTTPITLENIPTMRTRMLQMRSSDDDLRREGKINFEERKVPGPKDAPEISLLICRPNTTAITGSTPLLPCVYYIHEGGMIGGDNRFSLQLLLNWILEFNIVVVSVEYRLAPEHPHPAPSEDCYAGLLWTAANAQELGIDLSQLSVMGASAGGGLAAAMTLMARDRNGPVLNGQLLLCPMLDDRDQTPSTHQFEGTGFWDRQSNLTGWTALLGDQRGTSNVSPYAAPSRAEDLSNLPPAFIDVSSTETFRDEDIDYARRIWQAGGVAELHVWPGGFHGFTGFMPQAALSKLALEATTNWYRRLLASHNK